MTLTAFAEPWNRERSAHRSAKLLLRRRGNLAKSILGRQTRRAVNVEALAMKVIRAGLGHGIYYTTG